MIGLIVFAGIGAGALLTVYIVGIIGFGVLRATPLQQAFWPLIVLWDFIRG